ncbi:hypothetical protein BGW38_005015, partial [Lunasporangiospora selenospora]
MAPRVEEEEEEEAKVASAKLAQTIGIVSKGAAPHIAATMESANSSTRTTVVFQM